LQAAAWYAWLHDRLLERVTEDDSLRLTSEQQENLLEAMKIDFSVQDMDADFDVVAWFTETHCRRRRKTAS